MDSLAPVAGSAGLEAAPLAWHGAVVWDLVAASPVAWEVSMVAAWLAQGIARPSWQ